MTTEIIRTIIILLYSTDFSFVRKHFMVDGLGMKRIESRNNPIIKSINGLSSRREREEQGLFYFEGVHLLEEFLRVGKNPEMVFVREDVVDKYSVLLENADCEVYEVTASVYDKLTEEKAPQGLFAVSRYLESVKILDDESVKELCGNCLLLCDLQDTGNVGTVLRTAAALDFRVVLCGNCADVYSSKTIRATMGAIFTNPVYIAKDSEKAIEILRKQGKRVIATALTEKAQILGEFEIAETDCFVIGNEGKGLTENVISACDFTAIIPMSGKTESLNAAVASAMILWEAKRGRG